MSEREWRQEGEGRHPTLAGNIFDPNVQGGTSSGSGLTGGSATSGVTGASATRTAEDGSGSATGGYVQSALNMVGLGQQPDIVKNYETAPPTGGATGERSGVTGGSDLTGSSGYGAETGDLSGGRSGLSGGSGSGITGVTDREPYERSEGTSTGGLGNEYDNVKARDTSSGLNAGSIADRGDQGVSGNSIGDNSNAGERTQNDTRHVVRDATGPEDEEITDRATRQQLQDERSQADDPTASGPGQDQESGSGEGASSVDKVKDPAENKKAATRENHNAIPTAGGVQLGEKHWGESKIVPDNPKPQSEAGVQSSQNDKTTSANTAQNTGGASGPPGSSNTEEKEGAMDKIKHKLHMG